MLVSVSGRVDLGGWVASGAVAVSVKAMIVGLGQPHWDRTDNNNATNDPPPTWDFIIMFNMTGMKPPVGGLFVPSRCT